MSYISCSLFENVPLIKGNVTASGEMTASNFYGSFIGTASYASTASVAITSSYSVSGSRTITASYALTASNGGPNFNANLITSSGNAIFGAAASNAKIQIRAASGRHPYLSMTDPYGIGASWSSEEIFTITAPTDGNTGPQYVVMGTAGQGLMMFGNNGNVTGRKSGLPGADFFFDTRTNIAGVFKIYSMDVLGAQHVGLMQSQSGSVGIGFQEEPMSMLDVAGSLSVGGGLAGIQPAPANGLQVEGDCVFNKVDANGLLTAFSGFASAQGAGITGNLVVNSGQYYSDLVNPPGNFPEIDWNQGNVQKIYLVEGDNAITFINPKAGARYMLIIVQPTGTGGGTITWPTDLTKWPSGVFPTLTSNPDAVDIIGFVFDGDVYYGNSSLDFRVP
jgi:hypothetical protein